MRLICGFLSLDGSAATTEILHNMAAAMTSPGLKPTLSHHLDGALGMGVLDFSGQQHGLMVNEGFVIASDEQLYRNQASSSSVFTEALQRFGANFPDKVDGDFAVALWQRDTAELWLGRDFIGVRPLAWTFQPGRWFAFASLPKGLYGAGLASNRLDPVALASKLAYTYFNGADSGFAEIAYLQAGHSLCVRPQDLKAPQPHRAYAPDMSKVGSWQGSAEQAAETLKQLVQDAVLVRLPKEGAIATHLTGGLDSSSITVIAAREAKRRQQQLVALGITTTNPIGPNELDERPFIQAVLAQESNIVHVGVFDDLVMPETPEDSDWPGSIIDGADEQIFAKAAEFGAGQLLSGVGGDECASYNGANLYLRLLKNGHWLHLAHELSAKAADEGMPLRKAIRNRLLVPLIPERLIKLVRTGKFSVVNKSQGHSQFISPVIAEDVFLKRMPLVLQTNRTAERVCAIANHHIPSRCTYYAIMAARRGMSVSFPLLDRRVVDFILSLPVHMFLADGQSRQPFRRAMTGILPEQVRQAKQKVGIFDERFVRYALRKNQLLAISQTLKATNSAQLTGVFNLDAIHQMLEQLPTEQDVEQCIRAKPGEFVKGQPPWLLLFAIHFLRAAWRLENGKYSINQ